MTLRTLVIDDEPFARRYLRSLLAADSDFEIVGECSDGAQAVVSILELQPDFVLLDVQMPELDGFGVLRAVGARAEPMVVFCTAYDQYALKAFEAFALDYLLKPFDEERFARTLARVKAQHRGLQQAAERDRTNALIERVAAELPAPRRLLVKSGGRVLFLRFDDIRRIEADDNYVRLFTNDGEHSIRDTLAHIESQLPVEQFVRIHRSTVINAGLARELQSLPSGEARLQMEDGTVLTVSRRFRDRVAARLA